MVREYQSRFSYADRVAMTAAMIAALTPESDPMSGEDHGRLARVAARAIGCTLDDFRCAELYWIGRQTDAVLGLVTA